VGLKYTLLITTERGLMDIIKELFERLSGKDRDSIYLREIALLMEQMDELKAKLEVKENLVKNYENELHRRNQ
jgi:hypothetical protein